MDYLMPRSYFVRKIDYICKQNKVKKEEALRKIERTEDNLLRIRDIVAEVEKNIKYAERQARRAEKYKEHFDVLKRYEDGVLTDTDLWPWPYENLIKRDMGMSETITEYVRRQLAPFIEIPGAAVHNQSGGIQNAGAHMEISPNPFNKTAMVSLLLDGPQYVELSLFDIHGKLQKQVINREAKSGPLTITLSRESLSSGIYYLCGSVGNKAVFGKIVILK